jgi:hypothetical protein
MQQNELFDSQYRTLVTNIFLQQRARIVEILLHEEILESNNGTAGFWRGEEWVSVYDLLGDPLG